MSGRYLLDTHTVIWWLADPTRLTESAQAAIGSSVSSLYLSTAAIWEVEIKRALKRLDAPTDLLQQLSELSIEALSIDAQDAVTAAHLPDHHQDPFDRMMVAQAQRFELTFMTRDRAIRQYDVPQLQA